MIALAVFAYRRPEDVAALFRNRMVRSLLIMCLFCYFISQFMDRGLAKRMVRPFLGDPEWEIPNSTQMEETLEALGGIFLLCTGLVLRRNHVKSGRGILTKNG